MAIKLRVQDNSIRLKTADADAAHFTASEGIPIYPEPYTGDYTVTPSAETQTLSTEGLMMTSNVTVNPIPSNYGLITYNGSVITVS